MSVVQGTRNNPLDFAARKQMIQEVYPDIDVVYLKDNKSDEIWSEKLDEIIRDLIGPNLSAVLYGSRGSFITSYTGRFTTLELESTRFISGSEIRDRISKKAKPSYDWRAGAIWQAYNQYRKVWATVDAAIWKRSKDEILLAKKPGENGYRFVGGFSDSNSNSYEEDVIREVKEETGLIVNNPRYIGSFKIDDWRYRSEVDCIKTLFFIVEFDENQSAVANDDISEARWFKFNAIKPGDLEPEHRVLLEALANFCYSK
jgi:bifunctional NMN adenylyltransferase/nudix hydrolase